MKPMTNQQKLIIYHNPRCGKSRQGLKIVEESGLIFEVIKYLEQPPTYEELESIIQKLGIKPIELVRTKETVWTDNYKGLVMTDSQIMQAMVDNPILIERPIVFNETIAVLGRPPEKIEDIIK
jgi:arsenate reductase